MKCILCDGTMEIDEDENMGRRAKCSLCPVHGPWVRHWPDGADMNECILWAWKTHVDGFSLTVCQ